MALPSPETMLTYASILEKPKYQVDEKTGIKYRLATGEIVEAACTALRVLAQEPVAWLYESWCDEDCWGKYFSREKPAGNKWQRNIVPLYAMPPASRGTEA